MTRDEYRRRMVTLETALETGTLRPMAVYEAAGSLGWEYRRGLYGDAPRPVALARVAPALRREVEPLSWWRRAMRWVGW